MQKVSWKLLIMHIIDKPTEYSWTGSFSLVSVVDRYGGNHENVVTVIIVTVVIVMHHFYIVIDTYIQVNNTY